MITFFTYLNNFRTIVCPTIVYKSVKYFAPSQYLKWRYCYKLVCIIFPCFDVFIIKQLFPATENFQSTLKGSILGRNRLFPVFTIGYLTQFLIYRTWMKNSTVLNHWCYCIIQIHNIHYWFNMYTSTLK